MTNGRQSSVGGPQSGATGLDTEFHRGLGLYDSTMVVVGSMIGSGIFIVSADMARSIGSPGWLLVAWLVTGLLTVVGLAFVGLSSGTLAWLAHTSTIATAAVIAGMTLGVGVMAWRVGASANESRGIR